VQGDLGVHTAPRSDSQQVEPLLLENVGERSQRRDIEPTGRKQHHLHGPISFLDERNGTAVGLEDLGLAGRHGSILPDARGKPAQTEARLIGGPFRLAGSGPFGASRERIQSRQDLGRFEQAPALRIPYLTKNAVIHETVDPILCVASADLQGLGRSRRVNDRLTLESVE
jgi:hypothetical protein